MIIILQITIRQIYNLQLVKTSGGWTIWGLAKEIFEDGLKIG